MQSWVATAWVISVTSVVVLLAGLARAGIFDLMSEVTAILRAAARGDPYAAGQLLPLVYEELRRLAAQKLAHEVPGQTLQATALVHEAYLRLTGGENEQHWDGRGHFFAAAAEAMRRILVERARCSAAASTAAACIATMPPRRNWRLPNPSKTCWRWTRPSTNSPAQTQSRSG